jgi:excisionase family DNA binding protein
MPSQVSLLTKDEVALRLKISVFTLARLYKAGRIQFVRVGRQVRFRPEAVETYLQRQQGRAA